MGYERLFTSESVSPGHPDKVADQISDAVLDAFLRQDPDVRVACETLVKSNLVVIAGEVSSARASLLGSVDVAQVARRVIREIGYTDVALGFDADSCKIIVELSEQSKDISNGIRADPAARNQEDLGAGDQGLMFGYATDETKVLMPAPLHYAHRLMKRQVEVRANGLSWLRPDAKSQVTFVYDSHNKPIRVDAVVLSTQHAPKIEGRTGAAALKALRMAVIEEIIKPVFSGPYLFEDIHKDRLVVNSAGHFELGGPAADCGLTGRKIIVDTYGGMARHGGGAFSGKDPSKVDRSAAYAARYIAKHVVAKGMASSCELQLSYAIGQSEPISLNLFVDGDQKASHDEIQTYIKETFDLTPAGIIKMLDLKRPIYQKTAALGHFGREDEGFTWENLDRLKAPTASSSP